MIDREKVIKGLECCMSDKICNSSCPYKGQCDDGGYYYSKAIEDAIALLKVQEPRVMTCDELSAYDRTDRTVYVEERTKTYYNETAFVKIEKDYRECVIFNGQKSIFWYDKKDYGREWRCWTSRPTDAQREAIPWD